MKKTIKFLGVLLLLLTLTGCIKRDLMDDIDILVASYPIEYIVQNLYGNNSKIIELYPDGTNPKEIKFNNKQIHDFAKNTLYIYTGHNKTHSDLAIKFKKINKDLLLIDGSMGIDNQDKLNQIWLNPSDMLMLTQNIKIGLDEYLESEFLKKRVNKEYEKLKVNLSNLDADLRLLSKNANNKTIITATNALNFLNKYGFNVISIDEITIDDKIKNQVRELVTSGQIKHVYTIEYEKDNTYMTELINSYQIEKITFKSIETISDKERSLKKNYLDLMNENIDLIKKGTYK